MSNSGSVFPDGFPPPPAPLPTDPFQPSPAGQIVTPAMILYLKQTKPWVRFLAILGFIFAGLMVLAGMFMMVGFSMMERFTSSFGEGGMIMGLSIGLLYLLIAGLYIVFSVVLNRYASAIARFLGNSTPSGLEEALLTQRTFWRLLGITTVVVLCLYGLIMVGALAVGIMAGLSAMG